MPDFRTVTMHPRRAKQATSLCLALARDIAEEEAATAYDALSEEIQDLRDEVAGLRREMAALRRGVIEELVRLREALG